MKAEQKLKLAKTTIVTTVLMITIIAIVWLVVTHKPSSMKALVDFTAQKIEVDCTFYNEECTNGE